MGLVREVRSREVVCELPHGGMVLAIAWSADGSLIASGWGDNKVV